VSDDLSSGLQHYREKEDVSRTDCKNLHISKITADWAKTQRGDELPALSKVTVDWAKAQRGDEIFVRISNSQISGTPVAMEDEIEAVVCVISHGRVEHSNITRTTYLDLNLKKHVPYSLACCMPVYQSIGGFQLYNRS
jgi:hypothetical protein